MSISYKAGDKVRCINDAWSNRQDEGFNHTFADENPCPLTRGAVYTIKEIVEHSSVGFDNEGYFGPHLILEEVDYPVLANRGFAPSRFEAIQ